MNQRTRIPFAVCAVVAVSLAASGFAQAEAPPQSRQIAPHLYRVYGDYDLPRALVVPRGQPPEYSLERLARWSCHENINPTALARCASYFVSRKPFIIRRIALKEKASDSDGHSRYEVELSDGQQMDVWATEIGCNHSSDSSKLRVGAMEDRVADMRSPWGPEPYNNIAYNNMLFPGHLPYLQRVGPDGRVIWANVYLVRSTGHTEDKWENPVVENPLLGFGEVVCPKGSGSTGFLTSLVLRNGAFTFGAIAIEMNVLTGKLKAQHPRIRVVPAAEVEQHYRRALTELIDEGVIAEADTQLITDGFRGTPPPSRYLSKDNEFSERLQRNLLKTYFTNSTQGKNQ